MASRAVAALEEPTWPSLRRLLSVPEFTHSLCDADCPLNALGAASRVSARVALAAATGDAGMLHDHEEDLATSVGVRLLRTSVDGTRSCPQPSAASHSSSPEGFRFDATYIWMRPHRSARKRTFGRSYLSFYVRAIRREDAELEWQLRRPDGHWLDILRHDGRFYRPLLAPGSWEPISRERFVPIMGSGQPWRDTPTAEDEIVESSGIVLCLDDVADDIPPRTVREREGHEERRAEIERRCLGLLSIGGIIHRPTTAPVLRLVRQYDREAPPIGRNAKAQVRLAWECGTLASWSEVNPYAWPRAPEDALATDDTDDTDDEAGFPVACEPLLRALAIEMGAPDEGPIVRGCDELTQSEAAVPETAKAVAEMTRALVSDERRGNTVHAVIAGWTTARERAAAAEERLRACSDAALIASAFE